MLAATVPALDSSRYEFLRCIPLFAELPEADLRELARTAEEVEIPSGRELFAEGSPGDRAYVIVRGQLEIIKVSGGREILIDVRRGGDVIGEMSLLEAAPRMASVRARDDALLLGIHHDRLEHILATSPGAGRAMLYTVLKRLRGSQAMLHQSEKMAHLGTLSAGVAHELNNPAAAVGRGVDQLRESLRRLGETQLALGEGGLDPDLRPIVAGLLERAERSAGRPRDLSSLERSDREDAAERWLEAHGLDDGWRFVPTLIDLGLEQGELDALMERFSPPRFGSLFEHVAATFELHGLLAEIAQGAERISQTVQALKSYTYLDQAPQQDVDVHRGIDDTLLMLRYKLRGVEVRRDYADGLPRIEAYGSELNQVWTNLIDNAADALAGEGVITIRTRQEENWLVVDVEDDGPGIPEEHRSRVFDPFFTTKLQGEGTGLGLAISYKIVAFKHRGDLRLTSEPGRTRFEVWLPLRSG